jgi:RHS repeat-associated protein
LLQQKYRNTGNAAFTYDIDNHLLTGSAPTAATFTYDPFGRRWTDTGPTYFVPFIYDGPNLAMEYYSGAVLRRYVPSGLGVDQPLVWYEGAGTSTPRWLQADNLGSVVAYSDASGNQHVTTGYGPFGELASFYSTRYEYTGQVSIPELNLFDFKARNYDPNLGRFLSADPAGYASDINSYAYVRNDPVNGTDPSGMDSCPSLDSPDCPAPIVSQVDVVAARNAGPGQSFVLWDNPTDQALATLSAQSPVSLEELTVPAERKSCTSVATGTTGEIGLAGQGTFGVVSVQASIGVAFDSHGNVAVYLSAGPGAGAGAGENLGLTVQGSNAPTVQDLNGPFGNVSGGGGLVGGGTIDVFGGQTRNGKKSIYGGGLTAGEAGGVTTFAGGTFTKVSPSFNLFLTPTC